MKALAFVVLQPGCLQRLSRKNLKRRTVRLLTRLLTQQTRSPTHLCVKRRTVFSRSPLALRVNGYYGQTNKERSLTTDEETETETETEVNSKNTCCRERRQNENLRDCKFKGIV